MAPLTDALRGSPQPGVGSSVRVRAQQIIFHEGDPSDAIYVLLEGEVRTSVCPEGGADHTTLLYGAPALLGDRDLLANVAAQESAMALTPSRLVLFPRAALREAQAEIGPALLEDLARRYTRTLVWARLSQAPLQARLGMLLRDCLAIRAELPAPAYLAEALAASPKSISRAMMQLRELSILSDDAIGDLGTLGVTPGDCAFHRFEE
jgi:CRP-like cAMP-binding protein